MDRKVFSVKKKSYGEKLILFDEEVRVCRKQTQQPNVKRPR